MITGLAQRPEWSLIVALTIGLLIGADRERRGRESDQPFPAGVRTFALTCLLGALSARLGDPAWVTAAGVLVGAGSLLDYGLWRRKSDLTGEVALLLVYGLGVLSATQPTLALETGIVVAALLAYRVQIHRLVGETLSQQDLLDGLAFAVAALVVLPLLPDRALDPFGVINLFTLWRLVVVVLALNSIGYIAQRMIGARFGMAAAGFAGGLVSCTAAIADMAQRARTHVDLSAAAAAGAAASILASLAYLVVLVLAASPALLRPLAPSLGLAILAVVVYAAATARRNTADGERLVVGRAFNIGLALTFVGFVSVVTLASRLLALQFGAAGELVATTLTGLADAHAAAASSASLFSAGSIDRGDAVLAVLMSLSVNLMVKVPVAFSLGTSAFAWRVAACLALALVGLWIGYAATPLLAPWLNG